MVNGYPNSTANAAFSYYPKLAVLREYCEKHPADDLSLQKVAGIVGLERTYFCTYFHDKVGVCFHDWLALLRIENAEALMQTRDYPLSHVAYLAGFHSVSAFQRNYKRLRGITPSEFKKHARPT